MEQKIRDYEEYIKEQTEKSLTLADKKRLIEYHRDMVKNFQHERLIHLIIMLFFVAASLVLLVAFALLAFSFGFISPLIPFYFLTAIVVILTMFYIKHYYFLENHIQALYEYTKKLATF